MTPEERELLTQSIKLAEENNKILRGMRRSARFSTFFRILYWTIIIVVAFGSYFAIKPFIEPFIKGANKVQGNVESLKNITSKIMGE